MHYLAFDKQWFQKHQKRLLWLLRFKTFRNILRIDSDLPIVQILPHAHTVYLGHDKHRVHLQTDFRTHWKYSKRLYYAFKPLWWAMHYWDLIIDQTIPRFSFGFSTLTVRPDADPETTTVDGFCQFTTSAGSTWATAHDATASSAGGTNDTTAQGSVNAQESAVSSNLFSIRRMFFLFDTSALTASATVSAATESFVFASASQVAGDNDAQAYVDIYSSSPASNTALVDEDYDQVGTTQFATAINITALVGDDSTYTDFVLNASGLAAVSQTGVSKFSMREGHDAENAVIATNAQNTAGMYTADETGTSRDPKLVITYTLPAPTPAQDASIPDYSFRYKDQVTAY